MELFVTFSHDNSHLKQKMAKAITIELQITQSQGEWRNGLTSFCDPWDLAGLFTLYPPWLSKPPPCQINGLVKTTCCEQIESKTCLKCFVHT